MDSTASLSPASNDFEGKHPPLAVPTGFTDNLVVGVGSPTALAFTPTGAWTTWITQDVTVPLNGGTTNSIRFQSNGQDLGNIDQLEVFAGSGAP